MQIGIETYFRHINDTTGGINGRKVKLLALDDGYDPNAARGNDERHARQSPGVRLHRQRGHADR